MTAATAPANILAAHYGRDRVALVAFWLLMALLCAAIAAPWIAAQNPYDLAQLDILDAKLAPGATSSNGLSYWLGTDDQGRDMLSAILYGLRISIGVGMISALASASAVSAASSSLTVVSFITLMLASRI
jgi:peptide/nickel transport system permease protein